MTQGQALTILKTGANVFLTGQPGSGKSHTVRAYVDYLRAHGVEPAITASTGIAATHIGGMTIHSWSGIGIKDYLSKYDLDALASKEYIARRINKTRVLIIDEVSMLATHTVSMVDAVCKEVKQNTEPFGGLQVVLVGDFFQLPPVIKREPPTMEEEQTIFIDQEQSGQQSATVFAYSSPAWQGARMVSCYLTEQYRQDDMEFLSVLSAIRANAVKETHRLCVNGRCVPIEDLPENTTKLYAHNRNVDAVNNRELSKLSEEPKEFVMTATGSAKLVETLKRGCLSPERLVLKKGAAVMCTKNNPQGKFVNGTQGTVVDFQKGTNYPIVKTRYGKMLYLEPMEWTVEENGKTRARVSQIPLRLAWAITIHKSQGMSMDEAIMDLREVFEYGQGYVALSRVRRLSGLYILGVNETAFAVHPDVCEHDNLLRAESEDAEQVFGNLSEVKLTEMHKNFIQSIGGTVKAKTSAQQAAEKLDTYQQTLVLVKEGKRIGEIASMRGLTEGTIVSHLEKLASAGKIPREYVENNVPAEIKRVVGDIEKELNNAEGRLTPVFKAFNGKYSFEDIRLVRLFFGVRKR